MNFLKKVLRIYTLVVIIVLIIFAAIWLIKNFNNITICPKGQVAIRPGKCVGGLPIK